MSEENKAAGPLGWLRTAKDKFRAFAYGEQGEPKERPRVGLALAGLRAWHCAYRGAPRSARSWNSHRLRRGYKRRGPDRRRILRRGVPGCNDRGRSKHK